MYVDLLNIVKSSNYSLEAFLFLQRGLDYTVRQIYGEPAENDQPQRRHITGKQLCCGLRDYAIQEYGLLALTVMRRWRITRCEDFGRIVFELVDAGLMQRSQGDTIEDFIDVFDFAEAFTPQLSLSESN